MSTGLMLGPGLGPELKRDADFWGSAATPMLVIGRDDDHLQGIFRVSYDLLTESGKPAEWQSWPHPLHGYIFPERGADDVVVVDCAQEAAISGILEFLNRHRTS